MKSVSILFIPLIILIAFPTSSLSSFLSNFQDPKSSLLSAYASSSGNITMQQYTQGWFVNVNATDNYYNDGMKLALYSSQSFYTKWEGSCIDFYAYVCNECPQDYSATFSADYVQFSATGYMIQTNMLLDSAYWEINNGQTGYATNCTSFTTLPYGNGGYGMLALGLAPSNQNNFLSSQVFSISLNSSTGKGYLVFESESATFPAYTQVATLSTDNNWTISTIAYINVNQTALGVPVRVLFDTNSDMIGLPTSLYNFVLKGFQKNISTICSTASSGATCPYQGYIADLPNITLTVQNQNIPIPPQIYLKNYYSYSAGGSLVTLTLNFKELNSSLVNESYVTPAFENCIILDSNFMNYYMTVFNGSDSDNNVFTVGLYTQPHYILPGPTPTPPTPTPNPDPDNHTWIYIVVGVVGFIILIGVVICIVRVIKKRREANSSERFLQGNSSEEAPIVEQNMPPSYQYNQYNQYNVPPQQMQQMGYNNQGYYNQQVYENNQQQIQGDYAKDMSR